MVNRKACLVKVGELGTFVFKGGGGGQPPFWTGGFFKFQKSLSFVLDFQIKNPSCVGLLNVTRCMMRIKSKGLGPLANLFVLSKRKKREMIEAVKLL